MKNILTYKLFESSEFKVTSGEIYDILADLSDDDLTIILTNEVKISGEAGYDHITIDEDVELSSKFSIYFNDTVTRNGESDKQPHGDKDSGYGYPLLDIMKKIKHVENYISRRYKISNIGFDMSLNNKDLKTHYNMADDCSIYFNNSWQVFNYVGNERRYHSLSLDIDWKIMFMSVTFIEEPTIVSRIPNVIFTK
jgi:hypothetical protein